MLRNLLLTFVFFFAGSAQAMLIADLTPFTGDAIDVRVTAEDLGDDIKFTVEVVNIPPIGDLRGAFFHIADESLIAGLSITGADITSDQFGANAVIDLGGGNNLNGGGTPCPCDFAVEIGTSGIGVDDIQMTMFTLTHTSESLDLSLFDGQRLGVRVTSVGAVGGDREGSSKLGGSFGTIPEPSTAMLLGFGLLGLAKRRHF